MSSDHSRSTSTSTPRRLLRTAVRLLADGLILGLWVVFLTLVAVTTGGPRWVFYGLLLVGVGVYVQRTASWW